MQRWSCVCVYNLHITHPGDHRLYFSTIGGGGGGGDGDGGDGGGGGGGGGAGGAGTGACAGTGAGAGAGAVGDGNEKILDRDCNAFRTHP